MSNKLCNKLFVIKQEARGGYTRNLGTFFPTEYLSSKNLKPEKNRHLFRYGLRGNVNAFRESVCLNVNKKIEQQDRNMDQPNPSGMLSEAAFNG